MWMKPVSMPKARSMRFSSEPDSAMLSWLLQSWQCARCAAGTPERIINLLNAAVREALADPDVRKQYFLQGFEPKASSPSELREYVTNEIETYRKVIAEYGIKTQ